MTAPTTTILNVVARYLDGTMLKGTTRDFTPNRGEFHVHPDGNERSPVKVPFAALKAVFFVKSFTGRKEHVENNDVARARGTGRRVVVTFKDGETVAGFTVGYAADRPGFFIVPADPASNNVRVFVINAAVDRVEFVTAAPPAPARGAA